MSETSKPNASQDAVQVAFESISDLYKIVEKLSEQVEELQQQVSKAGRVGWQRESAPA